MTLEGRVLPTGTITGVVFEDFNANGVFDTTRAIPNAATGAVGVAVDHGIGGVTITAYDSAGVVRGTAVSASGGGTYTLNATGTGPYRIQFTSLPAGFFPGPHGATSGTNVQFVPEGNSSNVSFGLVQPTDYSQDNPDLVTTCYVYGDPINGKFANEPVIISFPYSAGADGTDPNPQDFTNPTSHALAVPDREVGSTWGLAFNRFTQTVYASSYMKKHVGFGPDASGTHPTTGAIYNMPTTGTNASVYVDLNAVFGPGTTGADPHTDYFVDNGNVTWDAVGKLSLGGMSISDDGSQLFAMNLYDRRLYVLPTSGPLTPDTIGRYDIPLPPDRTGVTSTNPQGDIRPFAVKFYRGLVYIGLVNSAEATQNPNDLRAYVYTFNPATKTFSSAPVFQFALNYPRGQAETQFTTPAAWNPWRPTFANVADYTTNQYGIYPQPMLSGIAFDVDGSMILALRDRGGDQFGIVTPDDPGNPSNLYLGISAGDLLRAFAVSTDLSSGWVLENNARGPQGQGTGLQNTGKGPGGAEFYQVDRPGFHDNVPFGGVVQVPGFPNVAITALTPARFGALSTGGVRWLNNATGAYTKAYQIYQTSLDFSDPFFGKANGLGDLIALSNPPPIEIGNRVWRDDNHLNGTQDADEPAIAGVTVRLYGPDGNLLATTTTDAIGTYYFSSTTTPGLTPNTAGFTVRLDNPADYAPGGPLAGLNLTVAFAGSDNTINSKGVPVGAFPRTTVNTGGPGQNNHDFDFGFYLPAISVTPGGVDVAITKSVNPAQTTVGSQVTYLIGVHNSGPDTATRVVVSDPLPRGLDVLSATPSQGTYNPATYIWYVGTLANGASATLTLVVQVNAAGQLPNTAVVSENEQDTNPLNNRATAVVTGVEVPGKQLLLASTGSTPSRNLVSSALPAVPADNDLIAVGADAGGEPLVQVFERRTGLLRLAFYAYDRSFTGGVRVAVADVNGDGTPDIITGAGPGGGPHVKVFDGRTGALIWSFFAYQANFFGGVYVAAADLNGDGRADIITGADAGGGPHVKVFDGQTGAELKSFFAYDPTFTGGVRVAVGDVNGDGTPDIITGAGPGGGPHVKVFDGRTGALLQSYFAYSADFRGGVYVAAADLNGDGRADIITGAGPGGGPHVKVFDGQTKAELQSFFAYDPTFTGGVRVGATGTNSGRSSLVTAAGPGGGSHVRVFNGLTLQALDGFFANDLSFFGGDFVGAAGSG